MGVLALLALIALRGKRWAYLTFVLLGLLYFPAQTHFRVHAPKCEQLLPTLHLLVPLLHNYAYIALFAGFYWMTWVQFGRSDARGVWALVATLLVAALVEIAEGMTGGGRGQVHCRVRDLVPDAAGAVGAALLLAVWSRLRRKPAYVRLGMSRPAAAPRSAAPTTRVVVPPRAVVPPPLPYLPGRVVPPPPDFSPGPSPVTPAADMDPTHEVAPRVGAAIAARAAVIQRLQKILARLWEMLQRLWMSIRRRRRTIVFGVVVLALGGAGALVMLRLRAAAPAVTVQPDTAPALLQPPPPPPRPLQSEAEGYYEPSYKFTVSDRRFTRLTLRPQPFVTFSRPGIRDEVGCADARISPVAAHLRCEFERVGLLVTIEGQFPSRTVTSRLDAQVLNAWVTVTNTRGETLFRARESFYWHTPD
ncbi:MAG: hypothetical protein DMD69_02115 [Gemmatimonadetes bacterium]|nr:MAG: hypothetical protein DMD69_02115 [Gemmatimonadota bacterium]